MCRNLILHLLRCAHWSLLLCLLVLLPAATSSASETQVYPMYQIMGAQLQALEQKLTLLDQVLAQQNPELTTLQLQLTESRTELKRLRKELSTSKEQLMKAEESLRNANLFLEKSAQEAKRERLRIKAQRNAWQAASVLLAVGLALK